MYWLKLSSRKQKTINNKIYFATEYAKDVLDKHAGEPCAYIEDINSIDIFPSDKLVSCGDDKRIKFWERYKEKKEDDE